MTRAVRRKRAIKPDPSVDWGAGAGADEGISWDEGGYGDSYGDYQPRGRVHGNWDQEDYYDYNQEEMFREKTANDYISFGKDFYSDDQYRTRVNRSPDQDLYREYSTQQIGERKKHRSGLTNMLTIFYEPSILKNFGLKLPLMQVLATLSLYIIYLMTFSDRNAGEVKEGLDILTNGTSSHISPWLLGLFGIGIGFFLSLLPYMKAKPRRMLFLTSMSALGLFIFLVPLFEMVINLSFKSFLGAFWESLIRLGKGLVIVIYGSPALLGAFGIWGKKAKGILIGCTTIILMCVLAGNDIALLIMNQLDLGSFDRIVYYLAFAFIIYTFSEMADAADQYYNRAREIPAEARDWEYVKHYNNLINSFFIHFGVVGLLVGLLVLFITNYQRIFFSFGSEMMMDSLEHSSFFGVAIALIVLLLILTFVGMILRNSKIFASVQERIREKLEKRKKDKILFVRQLEEYNRLRMLRFQSEDED